MSAIIRPAVAGDLSAILDLLERSKLPLDGLDAHVETMLTATDGPRVVGCAALELYGGAALLRSVAVDAGRRGEGLGRALTHAALTLARARGVETVYLLTETAGEFFTKLGFTTITREDVAPAVKQSVEFTKACPASALVMRSAIDRSQS